MCKSEVCANILVPLTIEKGMLIHIMLHIPVILNVHPENRSNYFSSITSCINLFVLPVYQHLSCHYELSAPLLIFVTGTTILVLHIHILTDSIVRKVFYCFHNWWFIQRSEGSKLLYHLFFGITSKPTTIKCSFVIFIK